MNENRTYSCPNCKAILVIPKSCWLKVMRCTRCDKEMKLLDDEPIDTGNLVQTNRDIGLTQFDCQKAAQLLNDGFKVSISELKTAKILKL